MRKFTKFFILLLSITLFVGLVGCEKIKISFVNENEELVIGDELQLEFTISDSTLELVWSTDDDTVITIDQTGKIKGLKTGTAEVTVVVKGKEKYKATITVTVKEPPVVDPTSVVISGNPDSAKVGEIIQLSVSVLPAAANQEVTWSSSDAEIATVDQTGKVTFVGIGEVVITATSKAKTTIKREVTIEVVAPDPTEIVVTTQTGVDTVMLYEKLQMVATVSPEIAVSTVEWSVSDQTIATISNTGLLDAKKVGKVVVTAKSTVNEEIFGTKEIEVILPAATNLEVTGSYNVIQIDEEMQLTTRILPELASQEVLFTSSDDEVVTVDANGKVKGIAVGNATITVKSASNENLSKVYAIKVVEKVTAPDHVNFLVDAKLADAERFTKVTVGEDEYILGINAFADFDGIVLSDESKIYVKPGTYTGNLNVNKNNIEIYTDNKDKNPNTSAFDLSKQAIFKGKISIAEGQDGLTINGLSITNTGKVEAVGTAKNFSFLNNNVYDTVEATKTWSAARDYTLVGVVTLWKQSKLVENLVFENNKFNNVSETNIIVGNTKGLLIKNNTFTNFDRDAIRIDGGNNYLSTIIEGNTFKNDEVGGYNGIYFRAIGVYGSAEDKNVVEVMNNHFENIGTSEDMSGALSTNGYQEFGAEVYIHHNTFVNCVDFIWLRNNATVANHAAHQWVGKINYNIFLGIPETYYHKNLNAGGDTEDTNPTLVNMDFNFFGDLDGNPVDLESDEIKAKFFSVKSLKYSYTSIEAMNAIFVSGEWSDKQENDEVLYDGMKFIFGVNAFATIADALEVVEAKGIIFVLPGTYDEEVEITKGVTLLTLNAKLNPVADDTAFKADSDTATTITNVWYINSANDVTIKGFSFTGAARVRFYGPEIGAGLKNFLYENNYAYDTADATIAWQQTAYASYGVSAKDNTTMPGFLSIAQFATWMYNTKIINNKFENVSDTNIVMICASGAVISGNSFVGSDRDAIRLDYASLHGTFDITDNVFQDIKYNGIYVRTYAVTFASVTFNIERNLFKNIGEASETVTPASTRIGAIATSGYSEANSATFNIRFNKFENNYNYISLRANVSNVETWATKPHVWKAVVEYNSFIDDEEVEFYFRNLLNASDTTSTNVNNVIFNHNFYGTDANTKVEVTAAQFDHFKADESNLVVYDTLAALEEAIENYNDYIKPFVVDPALAEKEDGEKVVYDGEEFEVGKHAFATLAAALEKAVAGKTIKVLAGTYEEAEVNIAVNDLKIYGPNKDINPYNGTRKDEAILKTKLLIASGVKNIVINGFRLDYDPNTSFVMGHADGLIDGFEFSFNLVNGAGGTGAEAPIRFKQASTEQGNKNFVFKFNYIRDIASDRGIRVAYVENISFIGNKLENITTDGIRMNDNGGSATGKVELIDNIFINNGQFALFLGASVDSFKELIIRGNIFENSGANYEGAAISIRKITPPAEGTTILIEKNKFKDSYSYDIRVDHELNEAGNLSVTISENEFQTPNVTIYTNSLTGVSKTLFKLNNKAFDAEGNEIDLADLFTGEAPRVKNATLEEQ
jgi:uncharacterized protein YjdB